LGSQPFLNQLKETSPLWLVLINIYPDIQLSNVRIANNRFVIRGKADKATDIVAKLNAITGIDDAQFDFPVRRSRNKDVFVISFTVTEHKKNKTMGKVNQ